jgi:two-component sensor histidine kinase
MNAPVAPRRHASEPERLAALDRYDVLDTPRERDFDDIAELASEICGTSIAVVNLIGDGRQFFKAEVGLGVRETPLETSFCGHAILQEDFMLVPDATQDTRFVGNPLVTGEPGLRFYAGALLKTDEGLPLGTLCVLDFQTRSLSEHQINALKRLARQVMSQLELRRILRAKNQAEAAIHQLNAELEAHISDLEAERDRTAMMSREIDHRVMNSLQFVSALLAMQSKAAASEDISTQLDIAANRVIMVARVHRHFYLDDAVDTICALEYARRLMADILTLLGPVQLNVSGETALISTTLILPLGLILNEIVTNAAKYGAKSISVAITPAGKGVQMVIGDDGPGLPADFDPAARKGLGMRVVGALVRQHRGAMDFGASEAGGALFSIRIG